MKEKMKKYLIIGASLLIIIGLLVGCAGSGEEQKQITSVDELLAEIKNRADTITSYEYSNEATAVRIFEENLELSTHLSENGLVAIEENCGMFETTTITSGRSTDMQEETETRMQGTYIDGETVYFGETVDESEMDYSKFEGAQNAIDYIDILNWQIELVSSSEATLLSEEEKVQGVDCYVVSLTLDPSTLMNVMIIPSVWEVLMLEGSDTDIFEPYLQTYSYQLWFAKDNLHLVKVYRYMELVSDEPDNIFNITYEWNQEFTRYNEELDIVIPTEATEAVIGHPLLAQGIREALGKEEGAITPEDLASLIELDLSHYGIPDFTGLEYCINLESLSISHFGDNQDLSVLSGLTKLKSLSLSIPGDTDLTPISNLINLNSLKISSLDPIDISPILTLPNITELALDWPSSLDITCLRAFPQLTSLTLYADRDIIDLTPLTTLNLTELVLSTSVVDISPLALLNNLQSLKLADSSVTDISPLAELHQLEYLYLEIDDDADFSPLSQLNSLKSLILSRHNISDLSMLSELTSLEFLVLDRNEISDISPLSELTKLTNLELDFNDITDLTPLSSLTELQYLSISNMEISDITPLAPLTNLRALQIAANDVSDISVMANFRYLEELYLTSNNITDISSLRGLTELHDLSIGQNPVSDITSLVENAGFGVGDELHLNGRYINEEILDSVEILESRGVIVNIS
ncbi:MAG: leucine-rich repeat domain-containing protein [Dehalococcoidia bacterium]|jgi:Leucine-rich repeat (LRR) protein